MISEEDHYDFNECSLHPLVEVKSTKKKRKRRLVENFYNFSSHLSFIHVGVFLSLESSFFFFFFCYFIQILFSFLGTFQFQAEPKSLFWYPFLKLFFVMKK